MYDQVQTASALLPYLMRKDVCSEPSLMASEPTALNDLPEEILLKILSHFGPEDLCLVLAKVCERWNVLVKDITLWNTLPYHCDLSSSISRITEVRCTTLLEFRTNKHTNFAQSSVLKVQNLKRAFQKLDLFPS